MPKDDHLHRGSYVRSDAIGGRTRRIVVGITAVQGVAYAARLLEVLRELGVETHVVISDEARFGSNSEEDALRSVEHLATHVHQPSNQAARISSGSFLVDGMIVAPCSLSAASAIAHGIGKDLIHRAADVTIKEGRPLVVLVMDNDLSLIASENLRRLESIRRVSVMRPVVNDGADTDTDDREITIGRLLRAVGIERKA
jgi:4-hydroxy-3-polyprenylbenzoate decarboxylase